MRYIAFAIAMLLAQTVGAGHVLQKGKTAYDRGDYATALREFRLLADRDGDAQFMLGKMYLGGEGVAQDYAEAVKWYLKAAEQGHILAQFQLAFQLELRYVFGRGTPQDPAEAAKWYRKAAERGLPGAQLRLAFKYDSGDGVPQDYAEAVKWYRKAAERGLSSAQHNLGVSYRLGQGVPQDYVQAHMWLSLAVQGGETSGKYRDQLAEEMSSSDISKAQRLASEWMEKSGMK